ncbi:MAG TPA: hypothetical protein PKI01_09775 [Bacteroidales bacterium]|nr:hypothetical protein [Bacteroidales bacterium]
MKKLFPLLIMLIFILSCTHVAHVEKRKYLPGYYVSIYGHIEKNPGVKTQSKNISQLPVEKAIYISDNLNNENPKQGFSYTEPEPFERFNTGFKATNNLRVSLTPIKKSSSNSFRTWHGSVKSIKPEAKSAIPQKEPVENSGSANKSNALFLLLAGLLGATSLSIFIKRFKEPGKISYWALFNRKKAVSILVAAQTLVCGIGLFTGKTLAEMGLQTSELSTNILLGLSAAIVFFYPKRKALSGIFKNSYRKQRLFSLLLTLTGFLLMANVSDRAYYEKDLSPVIAKAFHKSDNAGYHNTNTASFETISQASKEGPQADPKMGVKILLTIVAVILFLALCFGIGVLSCSLYCNGQGVLATIVAVGGGIGSLILLIYGLRAIWRTDKPDRRQKISEKVSIR